MGDNTQADNSPIDDATYSIVRCYHPKFNKECEVMQEGLTLEEAQKHCQDPDTACADWFDGYRKE